MRAARDGPRRLPASPRSMIPSTTTSAYTVAAFIPGSEEFFKPCPCLRLPVNLLTKVPHHRHRAAVLAQDGLVGGREVLPAVAVEVGDRDPGAARAVPSAPYSNVRSS